MFGEDFTNYLRKRKEILKKVKEQQLEKRYGLSHLNPSYLAFKSRFTIPDFRNYGGSKKVTVGVLLNVIKVGKKREN